MLVFLKGAVIGLSIAAPVGPIGLLCIRRSVVSGRTAGLVSGLGAATADTACALVGALGLSTLTAFVVQHRGAIQGIGGVAMALIGIRILLEALVCHPRPATAAAGGAVTAAGGPGARGARLAGEAGAEGMVAAYFSTLLLTLANPLTLLSFASVFAGVGLEGGWAPTAGLTAGVFAGSALWWLFLSALAAWLGGRLRPGFFRAVNGIAGGGIALFGAFYVLGVARSALGR